MTSSRNPSRDLVAFAGAASTGFQAQNTEQSQVELALRACIAVLKQCGLRASDIDGICGTSTPEARRIQSGLGIDELTWFANPVMPMVNPVAAAVGAVAAGLCDVVLCYHAAYRLPWNTASSLKDPYRATGQATGAGMPQPETMAGAVGYAGWASRYIYEFNAPREHFGYVALNSRHNAIDNPLAAMREPMTMDDYLAARMIRSPLCLLDMDVPVDGADAFVITTTERARDLPNRPVLVNAVSLGMADKNEEDQSRSLERNGQHVVIESLKAKGDFWIDDIDLYFPYDGFTIITLNWIENAGFCGRGEAGVFLAENRDYESGQIMINGRVPVNSHGGALSEGGTQGSGHIREAILQLQGLAGDRQVRGPERALVTAGGFFMNAQGLLLRIE
jgi:acetyl-CoA acetyltransferase